ncbi:MAG: GntR family transcriptional regulator [Phycisphaerales bacterium]|nr:GntR family transcriptional regulator [Phycisphaerales bacterium]
MSHMATIPAMPPMSRSGQLRVVQAVQHWIERGDLAPGDALPTMRTLAQTLSIDKATVCRALFFHAG